MKNSQIILEIIGTKDYREPEWVTQMEEMQEALRGMFYKKSLKSLYTFIDVK